MAASCTKTPVLKSLFNSEYCEIFQSIYFEEHLQKAASENVFIKIIHKEKNGFFNINIRNKWKCLLLFHDWFPVKFEFIHIQHFFGMVRNRSSHRRCSVGDSVLRNFAKFLGKHLCQSLFFNQVTGLRKKETDTGVFRWTLRNFQEHLEIFKNTFLTEHLWTTASWEINSKH